jgi:hypothetical protein
LVNAGINLIQLNVPSSANVGDVVFARFRFSSVGGLGIGGLSPNGEVEDYASAVTNGLRGDSNSDGSVDAADYVIWRKTLGSAVASFGGADGDGDGVVDEDDHGAWRGNFGRTIGAGSGMVAAALAAVDEFPSSELSVENSRGEIVAIGSRRAFQPSPRFSLKGRENSLSSGQQVTKPRDTALAALLAIQSGGEEAKYGDIVGRWRGMHDEISRESRLSDAVDEAFARLGRVGPFSSVALTGL